MRRRLEAAWNLREAVTSGRRGGTLSVRSSASTTVSFSSLRMAKQAARKAERGNTWEERQCRGCVYVQLPMPMAHLMKVFA